MEKCEHFENLRPVTPKTLGVCEACVAVGDEWVHLRECLNCGNVGCCDQSKNKHATHHFKKTQHPAMKSAQPDEAWSWCYVDEIMFDDSDD